jgi:hypothetical protein
MVANGATVLISMFGSMVGSAVWVRAGRVDVAVTESVSGCGKSVPVGVQGLGWKGVGVGEAFSAEVTNTNGSAGCADAGAGASVPHPTSKTLARSITCKSFFICYGAGGIGVFEGVNVGDAVAVNVEVAVGGTGVRLGVNVADGVAVGKSGTMVTPGTGVSVGTLGTHSN